MTMTILDAKSAARALRRELDALGAPLGHSQCLEIVARQLGFADWNTAAASLGEDSPLVGTPVPVLRMLTEEQARTFYLDYLGFEVVWEHRFEPELPLYLRIRRDDAVLDLSEHHGDGTPGSVAWIPVRDIDVFHADISSRPHPRIRPGIVRDAPGGPTVTATDPSGNTLRFCQPQG